MRKPFALAAVTVLATLSQSGPLRAAEIKVMASPGVASALDVLGPQFAAATGHKVLLDYEVVAVQKRKIEAGAVFDIAILSPEAIDDLVRSDKMIADGRASVGRSGMAVGARKGAPKPDVSTTEAFRRTMLNARLVSYSKEGLSGVAFITALSRSSILEAMQPRIRAYDTGDSARAVADGEAELIVTALGPLLAAPGLEIVGVLPAELQTYVHFTAGLSAKAQDPHAAKSFMQFLTAPSAARVLKEKGLEPG